MKRISLVLAVLFVSLGLSACSWWSSTVPIGPSHDCLPYWGGAANELLPLLHAKNAPPPEGWGPGWIRRIPIDAEYHSFLDLKTALEFALDAPPCAPGLRTPDKALPSVAAMAALADTMRRGVQPPMDGQPTGLLGDQNSTCHPSPAERGWLRRPDGGNAGAVDLAEQVLQALKDGLDM